ncbi:MAG: hypothetical protein J7L07_10760 [Candidatus Odinarchaeota archaeon]|nr:hypothetical protein [Candidatus Odinarchaeota archaeon]
MFFKKKVRKDIDKIIGAIESKNPSDELEASWIVLDLIRTERYKEVKKEVLFKVLSRSLYESNTKDLKRTVMFAISELFANDYFSFDQISNIAFQAFSDEDPYIRRSSMKIFLEAVRKLVLPVSKMKIILDKALRDNDAIVRKTAIDLIDFVISNPVYSYSDILELIKWSVYTDTKMYDDALSYAKALLEQYMENPDVVREAILDLLDDKNGDVIKIGEELLNDLIKTGYFKSPSDILPYLTKSSSINFLLFRDLVDLLISFEDFSKGDLLDFAYELINDSEIEKVKSGLILLSNITMFDWVPSDLLEFSIDKGLEVADTRIETLRLVESCFYSKKIKRSVLFEKTISLLSYSDESLREAVIYTLTNMGKTEPKYAQHIIETVYELYKEEKISKYLMLHTLFELSLQAPLFDEKIVIKIIKDLLNEEYEPYRRDEVASNIALIVCRLSAKPGFNTETIYDLFEGEKFTDKEYKYTVFKINVLIEIASCLIESGVFTQHDLDKLLNVLPENVVVSVLLPLLVEKSEKDTTTTEKYISLLNNVIFGSKDERAREKAVDTLIRMYEKELVDKNRMFSIIYSLMAQQNSKEVPRLGLLLLENIIDKNMKNILYSFEIKTLIELGLNNDFVEIKNLTEYVYKKFLDSELLPFEKKVKIINDWIIGRYTISVKRGVARMLKQISAYSLYHLIINGHAFPMDDLKEYIQLLDSERDAYINSMIKKIKEFLT